MKKLVVVSIITVFLVFLALGCNNPLETKNFASIAKGFKAPGGEPPQKNDLIAGKHFKVGTVTISNDEENLYVTYSLLDGWVMTESHLAGASSLEEIPQTTEGIPIPSQFPYKSTHDPAVTEHTHTILLGEFEAGDVPYIAAHATVQRVKSDGKDKKEKSAWAAGEEGEEFEGENWATYFCYTERIWEGDFDIHTEGDLAGYTSVTGTLRINQTNLTNIVWLECLTSIGRNLKINENDNLTSLTGLESLASIGGTLSLALCRALTSLKGLEGLTSISGAISMECIGGLTSLKGLESLLSIGGPSIES